MNSTTNDIKTMIGQMIMVGLRGTSPDDAKSFFDFLNGLAIGGVILYDVNVTSTHPTSHNIHSPKQVMGYITALQSISDIPLFIGVDQEGGQVNRLKESYGFPPSKSWAELGQINDIKETQSHSNNMASTLSDHGFNLNFAPVLDLSVNPDSFIAKKGRCFSNNPVSVSTHAELFILIADVTETWSETELIPYQTLMDQDYIPAIMTSHLFHKGLDPELPATLSSKILTDLLRNKMGFDGVIISDDPQMGAIANHYDLKTVLQLMIYASVDIFCFGNNLIYDPTIVQKIHSTIVELLDGGSITIAQIEKSYKRIMNLKTRIGLL